MKRFFFVIVTVAVFSQANLAMAQPGKVKVAKVNDLAVKSLKPNPVGEVPFTISRGQVENMIKTSVDKAIKGTRLYFGQLHGRPVEAKRKDAATLAVDLDLAVRVNNWFDPEADVDFDLRFSVQGGKLKTTISKLKVDVDSSWTATILSLGLTKGLDLYVESRLRSEIAGKLNSQTPNVAVNITRVEVQANGDVKLWIRK